MYNRDFTLLRNPYRKQTENDSLWKKTFNFLKNIWKCSVSWACAFKVRKTRKLQIWQKKFTKSHHWIHTVCSKNRTFSEILQKVKNYFLRPSINFLVQTPSVEIEDPYCTVPVHAWHKFAFDVVIFGWWICWKVLIADLSTAVELLIAPSSLFY